MKKKFCEKCKRWLIPGGYDRHVAVCDGTYFIGPNNPNKKSKRTETELLELKRQNLEIARQKLKEKHPHSWNTGLTKETDKRVAKMAKSISTAMKKNPSGVATWTKEQHRQHAIKVRFGGYRNSAGRSKKFKVLDSYGNDVLLQSSYEFRCSVILNEMQIKWLRPKALKYDNKNYFADFYLADYDVYLDPKNSYKIKIDDEKITKVKEQNSIKLFILKEEDLTKEFISYILGL
jgi:hypothetical protein